MGIIALVSCPAAVVMAVGSIFVDKNKVAACTIASYVCCILPILYCFFDINERASAGDFAGILDIYPTLFVGSCILVGVVTVINVLAFIVRKKKL